MIKMESKVQQQGKILILMLLTTFLSCSALKKESFHGDKYPLLMKDYYRKNKSDINEYTYFSISSYNIDNTDLNYLQCCS